MFYSKGRYFFSLGVISCMVMILNFVLYLKFYKHILAVSDGTHQLDIDVLIVTSSRGKLSKEMDHMYENGSNFVNLPGKSYCRFTGKLLSWITK